jgi:hypothetical protein
MLKKLSASIFSVEVHGEKMCSDCKWRLGATEGQENEYERRKWNVTKKSASGPQLTL